MRGLGRDQESHQGFLSVLSLALINESQVLFCPKFVKKVCCDHDALSLNNNKARFRSIEIERHSGETVALPTESRFILWNGGEDFRFTSRLDSKKGERSSEAYFYLCSARCSVTRRVGFWVVAFWLC